jgi:predicted tellurium resistance membrane protein TerC
MSSDIIFSLVSLILLEVILGVDNVIFISILADKLPPEQRGKLRLLGIGFSVILRLVLLGFISIIVKLDKNLFELFNLGFSGKDLILIIGGLFLLYKSTKEIYIKTEANNQDEKYKGKAPSFNRMLADVILLDLVFSIDSIITAVGMVSEIWVMYTAVIVSVIIILIAAKPISNFISKHPSFKILALCFLMIIGVALIAEGFEVKIPKGYIYFSIFFALMVDIIQMKTIKPKQ